MTAGDPEMRDIAGGHRPPLQSVMQKTFSITNFGCRASQSEGASIHQELLESHAVESESAYDANVVVVNSCTITAEADRDVRQTIRRIASRNPNAQIIVTGCYAQRAPEELVSLPQVRFVLGNSHKPLAAQLALNLLVDDLGRHGRAEILCSSIFLERDFRPASYVGSGGRTRAILKVQDGCNANCSFCVIPSVRGRSRSIEPEAAIAEVRELVARGYKEVVFSGIHLGTYGRDLRSKTSFCELICRALEVPGLERLRLSSIEPLEIIPELIEESPLTYLHVFPYSSRPGTVAAGLPNHVPEHVSRFRAKMLRNLIARKNETFRRNMIGSQIEVLTLEDGTALSSNFVPVLISDPVAVNEWVRVVVTGLHGERGLHASRMKTAHTPADPA